MNIDTMPAGRELDALVAERVMGWKLFASEPGYGRPPHQITLVLTPVPHYSTDIAATYALIDHLNNRKWPDKALCVIVATHHDGNLAACMIFEGRPASHMARDTFIQLPHYDRAGFFVDTKSYNIDDMFRPAIRVQAETPMMAVCLAALELAKLEGKL